MQIMQMIAIEGLPGSGKSTLMDKLAKELNARMFIEPVDTNPFLDLYYRDPKKYALAMQFHLLSERYRMHLDGIAHVWKTKQSVIFDRSIYGDLVFCQKNYEDGNMSMLEYMTYSNMRDVMLRTLMIPHFTIYLEVDPVIALRNIKNRNRECEQEIPLSYLQGLSKIYDQKMNELESMGTKLIRINWNEFGTVETIIKRMGIEAVGKTVPSKEHDELQEKYDNLNWMMEGLRK